MKKALKRCVFFAFLLCFFTLNTAAEQSPLVTDELQKEHAAFLESIPPEIADLLPEGFFELSLEESGDAVRAAGGISSVLRVLGKLSGLAVKETIALFATICGLLLLAAIFRTLAGGKSCEVGRAYSFCTTLAMAVLLLTLQRGQFDQLEAFFDTVRALCVALLPMMGTLYAMGGNVRGAVVNQGVLSSFLSVLETFCAGTVIPVAGLCLALALLDAITGHTSLRGVAGVIKRTYTLMIDRKSVV